MRKMFIITNLVLVFLAGCGANHTGVLDTSKLEKVEFEYMTKEEKEKQPTIYTASSLKEGKRALSFEMKLPNHTPFEIYRYGFEIRDLKHDGKQIKAIFYGAPEDEKAKVQFRIEASHPAVKSNLINVKKIKLDDDVGAEYKGNSMFFELEGVSYNIIY